MSSPHSATGYYTVYGEEGLHADHFSARLSFGDTQTVWARTGFLGFLRRTELTDASGGEGSLCSPTPAPEPHAGGISGAPADSPRPSLGARVSRWPDTVFSENYSFSFTGLGPQPLWRMWGCWQRLWAPQA